MPIFEAYTQRKLDDGRPAAAPTVDRRRDPACGHVYPDARQHQATAASAERTAEHQTAGTKLMSAPPPKKAIEGFAMDGAIPRVGMAVPMPASTKPPPAPSSQQGGSKPQAQK
jgi:hypothetical protein